MAHLCPECEAVCNCSGDIDDELLEGSAAVEAQQQCTHYLICDVDQEEPDFIDLA